MLLDTPADVLYRRHANLYRPMRLFCTDYRYIVRLAVAVIAAAITLLLAQPGMLRLLGIVVNNGLRR